MHHVPDCTGASCHRPRSGRQLEDTFALANVYDAEDRYGEAERLAQGVMTTYERTRFQDAESVAAARVALGRALCGIQALPPGGAATAEARAPARRRAAVSTERSACKRWSLCTTPGTRPHRGAGHAASAVTSKEALAGTE
jgi:hypothetical protein